MILVVKRQTSTEHIDTADSASDHRVVCLAILCGVAAVSAVLRNGVAQLQTEEAAARLSGCVKVGRGKGQRRQTERICGVGLLCGNDAASRPLLTPVRASEGDETHDAVTIDDRAP